MIVHAKRARPATLDGLLGAQRAAFAAVAHADDRHAAIVGAFLSACETHQALADAAFERHGCDRFDDAGERWAMAQLMAAAGALARAWRGEAPAALASAVGAPPVADDHLLVRPMEGYRHYALYPETYVAAAAALGPRPDAAVIGVRSIGAGLAALVAATIGSGPPLTVRPVGHPFARSLSLAAPLPVWGRDVLIADEGPGLSGASFAAAIEAARLAGPRSVILFPSHANEPGPQASAAVRNAWRGVERRCAAFEQVFLASGRLRRSFAAALGPIAAMRDVSAGRWRAGRPIAVHPFWERRKFDLVAGADRFRAKFAGLGPEGALKRDRAAALAAAGFGPRPAALTHGFLIEAHVRGRSLVDARLDRDALGAHLARYLGFRREAFPATAHSGADAAALAAMLAHNAGLALGPEAARAAERLACPDADLAPIETDNRLSPVEWIETPGGLIKTDAVDHCRGHDLIGCQDVLWDVVGAGVELGVDAAFLARALGRPRLREQRFLEAAYCAFRLGEMTLAAAAHTEEAERALAQRAADGYLATLKRTLQA